MNSVQLVGRLTRDPEVRYTEGGSSIARFALAVDRRFKGENGPTADFPNCVAFGKTAEFIEKYFHKGMRMDARDGSRQDHIPTTMVRKCIQQMWLWKIVSLLSQKDHNSRHRITVDSDQWVMMDSRIFRMISMKNCRLTRW